MTEHNDKIRALVLTALMVFSVFAGTVAFTGTAAAAPTLATGSLDPSSVDEGTTNSHDVTLVIDDVDLSDNTSGGTVTVEFTNAVDLNSSSITNEAVTGNESGSQGTTNVGSSLDTTNNEVTITFDDSNGNASETINVSFTIDSVEAPSVNQNTTVDIGARSDVDADGTTEVDTRSTGVTLTVVDTDDDTNFNDGGIVFAGQTASYDAAFNDNNSADGGYQLYERVDSDTGSPVRSLGDGDNGLVNVSTSGLDAGTTYFISNDGQNPSDADITFTIREQDFSAAFDSDSVDNDGTTGVEIEFDSTNRADDYNVTVTSESLSDEDLADIFDDNFGAVDTGDDDDGVELQVTGGSQAADANFSGIDGGDYNLTFEVTDTGVEDTGSITVNDVGAGETSFANSNVEVAQGDVANVTVEMNGAATSGTLIVGDSEEDGYQANISVEDGADGDADGEVTVQFNTYTAGNSSQGVIASTEDSDDSVTVEDSESISAILATGEYTIYTSTSSSPSDTVESPNDIGTLFIEERSTDDMQLWTAPGGADLDADGEDGVTESDINSLVEDGAVTQDDTITAGDYVVHQVSATGLEGAIEANGNLTAAIQEGAVTLTVEQANPVQNRDPKVINVLSSGDAVTVVEGDGVYYIAVNTGSSNLNVTQDGDSASLSDGDEYQPEFTVVDDRLLDSEDEADHQSVNATFEVESPDTSLDSDPVNVTAADGEAISGTTNLAPGTELTIRVRSSEDTQPRFFNTQTATVQADGTFNGTFNFSEQSEGDTFTVSVRSDSELASADGEVVAQEDTETPGTTTPGTTTTDVTTTPGTTTTDVTETTTEPMNETDTTEDTETSTPGFGAVLAVIALLGAALLAARRQE
ncbi:hypothetical protein BRC97_05935 [Halobacteriales archaeon QS_6_71_20]|nr:MAG: hypothetical protein BRC97_05935 [Halobacteriales archaeon QS_6_71_20]